jgi:hypothetical protein
MNICHERMKTPQTPTDQQACNVKETTMKSHISRLGAILLLCGVVSAPVYADPDKPETSPATSSDTRTYTTQSETRFSRKCGIYSGICDMHKQVEVGAYCVCQTPSGPIYGVVVP